MKKKLYYSIICLFIFGILPAVCAPINLIPYPEKVVQGDGFFEVSSDTRIVFEGDLQTEKAFYTKLLETAFGFPLVDKKGDKHVICIKVDHKFLLPEEGYQLSVATDKVTIVASSSKGAFYAVQSLSQLIQKGTDTQKVKLPVVTIEDSPRFSWRGCMLDVSRTFMDKELLKRYIHLIASYKLNVLHLHLSDDQGWRLEIKRYPRLTTVGSKFDPEFNEIGGYYTQEDMKEIINYALERNVTIVPEFELPGHESAAIASYPELSCRGTRPQIHPFFMGPSIHEVIFCAGKPEVYEFVYRVLDEIIDLFPSPYIHIGGDEAPKKEWKQCEHCQKVIRENHLANEEELQSYFVRKIGDYIQRKGKILVGWDEILDGGKLQGNEVVMYWRGWEAKKNQEAAQQGFRIISSPTSYCYFDYDYGAIDTKHVYGYDPVPEGTSAEVARNYIGVQANFWSHIDRSESRIDKQLFPRLFALSEVGWSRPENKDWKRFKSVAQLYNERLRANQVNCYYDKTIYLSE